MILRAIHHTLKETRDDRLLFYLNAEIEEVRFKITPKIETLHDEVVEYEAGQLFIVSEHDEEEMLSILPLATGEWKRLGRHDNQSFYAIMHDGHIR